MKSEQTMAVMVWLWVSKTAKKTGRAPIYIRITIDGLDTEISTGQSVCPGYWDGEGKKCLPEAMDADAINSNIEETVEDLKAHFRILKKMHDSVTHNMVKNVFQGKPAIPAKIDHHTNKELDSHTLLDAINLKITEFQEQVTEGDNSEETLKQWRATRNKIRKFIFYKYKATDIDLCQLDIEMFGKELYRYLTLKRSKFLTDRNVQNKLLELHFTLNEKGNFTFTRKVIVNLQKDAAHKQMKNIKHVFDLAVDKLWMPRNPLAKFKCDRGEIEVRPLELEEVHTLCTKEIGIDRLRDVRDCYVAQIFTGFAFQDIAALSDENIIRVGKNGERWLSKPRGKTDVNESVPILPVVERLIEKYKDHPCRTVLGKLFPVPANSNYNGYLKEIAVICDINRELKTHLARHQFADIMLNECNVPLEDVSKMLGHKSIRTTMRYCKVRRSRISINMKLAKEYLFGKKRGFFKDVA